MIDEIDPDAFVTQSQVMGVFGKGFDKFKVKKKSPNKNSITLLICLSNKTNKAG